MSLLNDDKHPSKLIEGMLNTASAATRRIAKSYNDDPDRASPLEFLLDVLNDSDVHMRHRITAAKTAMPYMHQQLPSMVEVSGRDGGAIEVDLLATDAHRALEAVLIDVTPELVGIDSDVSSPSATMSKNKSASLLGVDDQLNSPITNLNSVVLTEGHSNSVVLTEEAVTVPSTVATTVNSTMDDPNDTAAQKKAKAILKKVRKTRTTKK